MTEQAVYGLLWAEGTTEPGRESRLVSLGLRAIAKQLGTITERNLAPLVNRLIRKLAIEITKDEISRASSSRQYRVFSYNEILERRKRAGLEWVIRSSRGVDFVDPTTGKSLLDKPPDITSGGAVASGAVVTSPPAIKSAPVISSGPDKTWSGSPDAISAHPPDVTSPPLGKEQRILRESSSSDAGKLRDLLTDQYPIDRKAAQQLVTECRTYDSSCTLEEIAAEVRRRWSKASRNPVGLVLATVPDMFPLQRAGKPIVQESNFDSTHYRSILDDPDASDAEKDLARQQLDVWGK